MSDPADTCEIIYKTVSTTMYRDKSERGPNVPYAEVDHGNGQRNNGYFELKGHPEAAAQIPEAVAWPELASVLAACAEASSPLRTLGCEKFPRPIDSPHADGPKFCIGSYVNIALADVSKSTEGAMRILARALADHIGDVQASWIDVEIGVEPFVFFGALGHCLLVRMSGYGPDEEWARKTWGYGCTKLVAALKAAEPLFTAPNEAQR